MTSETLRLEPPPSTLPPGSTVWMYLRDSGGPTQDRSIQQQREMMIEYCAQYGLILSLPPFEDIHKSGGSTQGRNDFDYMMSLSASADKPNGLLIWNFARFSRGGAYDSQLYKSVLRHRGIVIHSLTDKIPEGEFGPVIETIIDIANKQKKDEAAMGAWRGLRHNVKQGAVSGTPPRGMLRTPVKIISAEGIERPAHRWDPDPDFKARINKAFRMRAQGSSLAQIHVETKLYSSINTYVTFFNNPIYIGTLHFGEMIVENYCAPTIPRSIWDKVQTIIQANAQRKHVHSGVNHPRRTSSVYIFSGILKCARCGGMMNGMNSPQPHGRDYRRYNCATAKNKKTCTAKPVPAEFVEKLILDKIHKFFDDPQNLIDMLTAIKDDNEDRQSHVDEERASLSAQLASVRRKLSYSTDVLTQRPHSPSLLKKHDLLEEEETALLSKLAQLKAQSTAPIIVPTVEQARKSAHRIQEELKSKDPQFVRQKLLGITSEIFIDRTGKHLIGRVIFYHTPTIKKKPPPENVFTNRAPVGALIYKHILPFEATIPNNGRPKKKPVL